MKRVKLDNGTTVIVTDEKAEQLLGKKAVAEDKPTKAKDKK